MTKVNPEGIIARKDGDEHKKFPNGLKATLKAIRKFWSPKKRSEFRRGHGRTPLKFAEQFMGTYNRVGSYYREDEKSAEAIAAAISRLEGSGKVNLSDINFWKLRAYAEFVEVPSSILLLFAQLTSYEGQGRSRQEITNFLNNCASAVCALQRYIEANSDRKHLFHERLSEDENQVEFIARLAGLYNMSAAFGGWSRRLQDNSTNINNGNKALSRF